MSRASSELAASALSFADADALVKSVDAKGWVRTSCWEAVQRYPGTWAIRYRKRARQSANAGERVWVAGKSALFDSEEDAKARIVHFWGKEETYKGHAQQLASRDAAIDTAIVAAETAKTWSGSEDEDDDDDDDDEADCGGGGGGHGDDEMEAPPMPPTAAPLPVFSEPRGEGKQAEKRWRHSSFSAKNMVHEVKGLFPTLRKAAAFLSKKKAFIKRKAFGFRRGKGTQSKVSKLATDATKVCHICISSLISCFLASSRTLTIFALTSQVGEAQDHDRRARQGGGPAHRQARQAPP